MLDDALLRPGRLEVHVEIGLPDELGRVQIITIHTKGMKDNGFLDAGVDVETLAGQTNNYTGAEIEGVCKAAASYAFERNIDKANMTGAPDIANVNIHMDDFERAIAEIKPAFWRLCGPVGTVHAQRASVLWSALLCPLRDRPQVCDPSQAKRKDALTVAAA